MHFAPQSGKAPLRQIACKNQAKKKNRGVITKDASALLRLIIPQSGYEFDRVEPAEKPFTSTERVEPRLIVS